MREITPARLLLQITLQKHSSELHSSFPESTLDVIVQSCNPVLSYTSLSIILCNMLLSFIFIMSYLSMAHYFKDEAITFIFFYASIPDSSGDKFGFRTIKTRAVTPAVARIVKAYNKGLLTNGATIIPPCSAGTSKPRVNTKPPPTNEPANTAGKTVFGSLKA